MIQLETSTTIKLRRAFLNGFSNYLPFSSYDSNMFLLKRLAGVPGYQYRVKDEVLQPQIYTDEEIMKISNEYETRIGHEYRKYLTFNDKLIIIDYGTKSTMKAEEEFEENFKMTQDIRNYFEKTFKDEIPSKYSVYILDDSAVVYDDRNYHNLSFRDKMFVNLNIFMFTLLEYSFPRMVFGIVTNFTTFRMERRLKLTKIASKCIHSSETHKVVE
jgi:hypothetical protein